jgi:hypothetical protein
MKWHQTEKEQQYIQKQDEIVFQDRFELLGYKCRKINELRNEKSPDFEIENNGQKVIVELKSRFSNEDYNRIASEIATRLSAIRFGYDYRLTHFFEKKPDEILMKSKLHLIKKELATLDHNTKLPYALRIGDLKRQNISIALISMNPSLMEIEEKNLHQYYASHGDNAIAVELICRNDVGFLRCTCLSGNSECKNLLVINKRYFENTLEDAKKQIEKYIGQFPIGVFYFNHTIFGWDDLDIISLYGDLKVAFPIDPNIHESQMFLGENQIIREQKKEWLSFIGVLDCHINPVMRFYRNGFSNTQININFFNAKDVEVHTIHLSDDKNNIVIEKE